MNKEAYIETFKGLIQALDEIPQISEVIPFGRFPAGKLASIVYEDSEEIGIRISDRNPTLYYRKDRSSRDITPEEASNYLIHGRIRKSPKDINDKFMHALGPMINRYLIKEHKLKEKARKIKNRVRSQLYKPTS